MLVSAIGVIAFDATRLGWGVGSPSIGHFGLLVCLSFVISGWRWGLAAACLSAAAVLGLALAQQQQWLGGDRLAATADSLWLRAAIDCSWSARASPAAG